jgi:hypothetical protein
MEISKQLVRKGDDIYWQGDKKFNISIATCSSNSSLIHYAVNITNKGTPVKTCCLDDFSIETEDFILSLSKKIKNEWDSIIKASCKIKTF